MTYATAIAAPPRFQWEQNSQYSQSWNCGPTSVTRIACFFRDTWYGIEATRKLISGMGPYNVNGVSWYGAPPATATNAWQQRDMLIRRGVPASVRQLDSVTELHGLVDSGRRPVLVGIEMSRVDPQVRGHDFTGWHAVVVLGPAFVNGMRGVYINDPNFNPLGSYGADPTRGRRFYSDAVLIGAWEQNSPRYCVVPDELKVVAAPPPPKVGGLPVNFDGKRAGDQITVLANKPRRLGPSLTATSVATPPVEQAFRLTGSVDSQIVGGRSTWWFGPQYFGGRWRIVYIPQIDVASIVNK